MIPKFRMWHPERKIMETVTTLEFHEDKGLDYICVGYDDFGFVPTDVILMQSTGLTDKNGVEIFEGDIVKYRWTDKDLNEEKQSIDSIVWDKKGLQWVVSSDGEPIVSPYSDETIEVIGSIYENLELMEVTE